MTTAIQAPKKPKARVKAAKAEDCIEYHEGYAEITLTRPTVINGQTVDKITMREPTVRDQKAAQKQGEPVEIEIHAMSNLCTMTPDDVEGLPLRDFRRLQVAYMGFID